MEPFKNFSAMVAPLDRANVDTDQIIPKQFLKAVVRSGLKRGLFFDWRLNPDGSENPDFVLNQARYREAAIIVARRNFGSGSSREHAVWALRDQGIRAVIAPSFADIFRNNSLKCGLLPIVLAEDEVESIFRLARHGDGVRLTIDLQRQTVFDGAGFSARFEIDPYQKKCLLEGLDDIAVTLSHADEIAAFEAGHPLTYRR